MSVVVSASIYNRLNDSQALVTDEVVDFVNKHVSCPTDFRDNTHLHSRDPKTKLSAEALLYRGSVAGGPRFPRAVAAHLNEYLAPHTPIAADTVQCVGAATAMHDVLAWAVADPGDGVLTSRPVYGRFELDFGNKSQVRVVYADTDAEDCFDESVVDRFEEALRRSRADGVEVKMVLIVNPNNPLGWSPIAGL